MSVVEFQTEEIVEEINLKNYPVKKWYSCREDGVVMEKYPQAKAIYPLQRMKNKTKAQKIMDILCCLCTDAPDSGADFVNAVEDLTRYYLVEEEGYLLVNITKEHCITRPLPLQTVQKKLETGGATYRKSGKNLVERAKKYDRA